MKTVKYNHTCKICGTFFISNGSRSATCSGPCWYEYRRKERLLQYARNPEKFRERARKEREADRDRFNERQRRYRALNYEKVRALDRAYQYERYQRNKALINEKARLRREKQRAILMAVEKLGLVNTKELENML